MTTDARRRSTLRLHLVITSVTATAGFAAVIAVSLFVPVMTHLGRDGLRPDEMIGVADHILFLHAGFWPVVAVSLFCSMASGVWLYERMKAPLVRWVRAYSEIAADRVPDPVVIRRTDYLHEEADALNRMIEALRGRRAALDACAGALREALGVLESELPAEHRPALDAVIKHAADLRIQLGEPKRG